MPPVCLCARVHVRACVRLFCACLQAFDVYWKIMSEGGEADIPAEAQAMFYVYAMLLNEVRLTAQQHQARATTAHCSVLPHVAMCKGGTLTQMACTHVVATLIVSANCACCR